MTIILPFLLFRRKVLTAIFIAFWMLSISSLFKGTPVYAQEYIINDTRDLPDENIDDNIFFPRTLRSALENLNRHGGTKITFLVENQVFVLTQGYQLQPISKPVIIVGKGNTIDGENYVKIGLFFLDGSDGSVVSDLALRGFTVNALNIQSDNSTFVSLKIYDNNGPGIVLNNASGNQFFSDTTTYLGFLLYNNSGDAGFGMQIDEESHNNKITRVGFGADPISLKIPRGNSRAGLLIRGDGVTVKECFFAYNKTNGIEFDQPNKNTIPSLIKDCTFQLFSYDGISYELAGDTTFDNPINQKSAIFGLRAHNVTVQGCAVGVHRSHGIDFGGASVSNITIDSNNIGMYLESPLMPSQPGIPHRIGGTAIRTGRDSIVISRNKIGLCNVGISIGQGSNYKVWGNTIGYTDKNMVRSAITSGLVIGDAAKNVIIGDSLLQDKGNTIFGCGQHGIWSFVTDPTNDILIANNRIGFPPALSFITKAIPCLYSGIELQGALNTIRIYKNIIVGQKKGIALLVRKIVPPRPIQTYTLSDISVVGNIIGIDSIFIDTLAEVQSVRMKIAGIDEGIHIEGVKGLLIDNNVITSCNVGILGSSSLNDRVVITKNQIGSLDNVANKSGGNRSYGILLIEGCSFFSIGSYFDVTSGNRIYNNKGTGILIKDSSHSNTILYNRLEGNLRGSIGLEDAQSYYSLRRDLDSNDSDDGANSFQNSPYVLNLSKKTSEVKYSGEVIGNPGEKLRIDTYLTRTLSDSMIFLQPAIEHIEAFEVEVSSSGKAEFERILTDSSIVSMLQLPMFSIAMTATNQKRLETSQLGRVINNANNAIVDLTIQYDSTATQVIDNNIATTVRAYNILPTSAQNVTIKDIIPTTFKVDSAHTNLGTYILTDSLITLQLSVLNPDDSIIFKVWGKETQIGNHRRIATITSLTTDVDTNNNDDSLNILITTVGIPTLVNNNQSFRISANREGLTVEPFVPIVSLEIINIAGEKVYSASISNMSHVLVENLAPGLYFVKATKLLDNSTETQSILYY